MSDNTLKEQLIQTTISLIREEEENITVRKIAEQAGVGVGLINYHFQTKENLIDTAVQRIVDEVIAQAPSLYSRFEGTQEEKLKQMVKSTLRYLAANSGISRISILRDMSDGHSRDNTQMTIKFYDGILKSIIPDEGQRFLMGHVFCASLQVLLLRAEVLREAAGFDFYDDNQRDRFADDLIDALLKGLKP